MERGTGHGAGRRTRPAAPTWRRPADHLPAETGDRHRGGVLSFATGQIANRYLPTAAGRTEALGLLSDLAADLLNRARETEGRGETAHRRTDLHPSRATTERPLREWLADDAIGGDPELRWQILYRLAALGATQEAEIRAEAERDPGAKGEEGAARCLAALPQEAAKAAAWDALFDPADVLSNYLFTATAQGFWQAEEAQLELLRPYVARYFPAAAGVATRRGHALAVAAAKAAFPHPFTERATLTLAEAALREDLPAALHRKLTDETDDLRRALRVRSRS